MHLRWGLALPAVILSLGGLAEAADSGFQRRIDAAVHLYKKLDYEDALEQLYRAKSYSTGVDDDVVIALYRGIILADMGKEDESADSFRTGLFLKPEAALPISVPPKVRTDFERIKAEVKKELAKAHSPPLPKATPTAPPTPTAPTTAPPDATATTAAPPAESGALRRYAWIPVAAGGVIAAGGVYGLVHASQDASSLVPGGGQVSTLTGPQAQSTRDDGKLWQTLGVVGVCVGAAAVVAGGAMFAFGSSSATPAAWVAPGGGGLGLTGTFP